MDGNANILNAIADGTQIQCTKCNSMNDAGSRFCMICGTPLVQTDKADMLPFATINDTELSESEKIVHQEETATIPFMPLTDNNVESEALAVDSKPRESGEMPLDPVHYEFDAEQIVEEVSAFAKGLPDWDIVPPNAAVRRKLK